MQRQTRFFSYREDFSLVDPSGGQAGHVKQIMLQCDKCLNRRESRSRLADGVITADCKRGDVCEVPHKKNVRAGCSEIMKIIIKKSISRWERRPQV